MGEELSKRRYSGNWNAGVSFAMPGELSFDFLDFSGHMVNRRQDSGLLKLRSLKEEPKDCLAGAGKQGYI